jgi:16S rRNA processing protein RimM
LPRPDTPAAAPSANGAFLTLGQIATAHGIKGWVLVRPFSEISDTLLDYKTWQLASPSGAIRTVKLLEGAAYQDRLRVRLEGISDRDAALALSGWQVQVARGDMPALDDGEYYRDDLLGFEVRNVDGVVLGKLDYFADLPTGAVMVIRGENEHWVPSSPQHLLKIHAADRWISVNWPAELA